MASYDEREAVDCFARGARDLLSAAALSRPGAGGWDEATRRVATATATLRAHVGSEAGRIYGQVREYVGRGQVLVPPLAVHAVDDGGLHGTVVLDRFYLGRGGAHGGVPPLLFDEVMSHLAHHGDRPPARTAYLTVNFRAVTPLERPLDVTARILREEGRKRYVEARLLDGDRVLCDAEALFVELRPGQP